MPLLKRRSAFDDPSWIFELKYDGFRALAIIDRGRAKLISLKPDGCLNSYLDVGAELAYLQQPADREARPYEVNSR